MPVKIDGKEHIFLSDFPPRGIPFKAVLEPGFPAPIDKEGLVRCWPLDEARLWCRDNPELVKKFHEERCRQRQW